MSKAQDFPDAFDPKAPIDKRHGAFLPHWTQENATYFVTFRLADSLPKEVVRRLKLERQRVLERLKHQGDSDTAPYELKLHLARKIERILDEGHGDCALRLAAAANVMANALSFFDNQRYQLWSWAVMPNHVHAVVEPLEEHSLQSILHSWKSFTSKEINKLLGRNGALWQQEYFDHLIRNENSFLSVCEYVVNNPVKARLQDWPWVGTRITLEND